MKFTRSRDGEFRATVRIEFRIDAEMFDWLSNRVGKGLAERRVRRALEEFGEGAAWRHFAYDRKKKEVSIVHTDDVGSWESEDLEVCPDTIWG